MDKEQILIKHLKTMLKRTKQSYVTVEQMKETPEYSAVLNAMAELEQELVKNNGVLPVVSGCFNEVAEWWNSLTIPRKENTIYETFGDWNYCRPLQATCEDVIKMYNNR